MEKAEINSLETKVADCLSNITLASNKENHEKLKGLLNDVLNFISWTKFQFGEDIDEGF